MYPNNNPYYQQYPYNTPQQQRLMQMEQQQQQQVQMPQQMSNQNYLKGRPVVSIEEARAAQIDLDGSLFVFTDIGNKKIQTKQINLDGTATLNTYSLVDNVVPSESYVTKSELNEAIEAIKKEWEEKKGVISDNAKQQSGSVKTTAVKQSAF